MKKVKLILYALLLITIGILLVSQWKILSSTLNLIPPIIPTLFIISIIIIASILIMEKIHVERLKSQVSRLEKDNLNLKAKLFDQEEERREVDRSIQSFEGSLDKTEEKPKTTRKKSSKNSDGEK